MLPPLRYIFGAPGKGVGVRLGPRQMGLCSPSGTMVRIMSQCNSSHVRFRLLHCDIPSPNPNIFSNMIMTPRIAKQAYAHQRSAAATSHTHQKSHNRSPTLVNSLQFCKGSADNENGVSCKARTAWLWICHDISSFIFHNININCAMSYCIVRSRVISCYMRLLRH